MTEPGAPLLHQRFPALVDRLPHARLGTTPTAVTEVADGVWVKDEGAYGDGRWGGNKVRKLEWLLPEARRRGRRSVLTFGALGTNHGLATAYYAQDLGLHPVVAVVDQPLDAHVERQYALLRSSGASVYRTRTKARTAALVPYLLLRHRPYVFPAGGSNAVGVLGTVEAGLEFVQQVHDGAVPEPSHVVTAVGTGGTAAGLALAFALGGLATRVHAVVVNDTLRLDATQMAKLAQRTRALLISRGADVPEGINPIEVDRSELGPGYGVGTPAGAEAIAWGERHDVHLDPVYTGKAVAALHASRQSGRYDGPVVLWRTHGPR